MRRWLLVMIYLGAMVASIVLFNANAEDRWIAVVVWAVASIIVGLSLARWGVSLLPFLAIPIAIPFGYADRYLGSDSPQVWWFALMAAPVMSVLILAATVGRKRYNRSHASTPSEA